MYDHNIYGCPIDFDDDVLILSNTGVIWDTYKFSRKSDSIETIEVGRIESENINWNMAPKWKRRRDMKVIISRLFIRPPSILKFFC